ncbi:hypothetical protein B566_EDAN004707 [Ephemera danica]|nr:hypothetical protein B566_EDAN004707 [Ephemera danica]
MSDNDEMAQIAKTLDLYQDKEQYLDNLVAVIGAIDCIHIKINLPLLVACRFYNRKQYSSLNVQFGCR